FFFQAEDGIRDRNVTGVQTCALPISRQTVEAVIRKQISSALGGGRGIAEGAIPTLIFTICWLVSHELKLSLILGVLGTLIALAIRLLQRSTVQFTFNALLGMTIAAI